MLSVCELSKLCGGYAGRVRRCGIPGKWAAPNYKYSEAHNQVCQANVDGLSHRVWRTPLQCVANKPRLRAPHTGGDVTSFAFISCRTCEAKSQLPSSSLATSEIWACIRRRAHADSYVTQESRKRLNFCRCCRRIPCVGFIGGNLFLSFVQPVGWDVLSVPSS